MKAILFSGYNCVTHISEEVLIDMQNKISVDAIMYRHSAKIRFLVEVIS
jgi:hypothetical protein